MSKALLLSNLLVGFLASFLTWAIIWSLSDQAESHFGLKGNVTTLTFVSDEPRSSSGQDRVSTARLQEFLRARSLTLLIASLGDGAPQVAVYNAEDRVAWLPSTDARGTQNSTARAYLFKGTYSFDRWTAEGIHPLVPDGIDIVGAIARPPGVDRHQFAVVDPPGILPGGQFVLTTVSRSEVDEVIGLVSAEGLSLQRSNAPGSFGDLFRDPLVWLSLLMLATGIAGTVTYWSILFAKQELESKIRSQSGASVLAVVLQYLRRFSASPLAGVPLGCVASLAIVRMASGQWPEPAVVLVLSRTAGIGAISAVATLFVVLLALVRRQVRVE